MVTRFVVNYYILPIDVNAVARQNVVITTFCNVTTFWVATSLFELSHFIEFHVITCIPSPLFGHDALKICKTPTHGKLCHSNA